MIYVQLIKKLNCKCTVLPWTVFYIGRYISQVILSFLRCDSCWKHLNFGMYCPKYCENSLGKMEKCSPVWLLKSVVKSISKFFFCYFGFSLLWKQKGIILKDEKAKVGRQTGRQAGRWKISPLTWKRTCSENIGMELNIKKMQKNDFFGVIWKIFL